MACAAGNQAQCPPGSQAELPSAAISIEPGLDVLLAEASAASDDEGDATAAVARQWWFLVFCSVLAGLLVAAIALSSVVPQWIADKGDVFMSKSHKWSRRANTPTHSVHTCNSVRCNNHITLGSRPAVRVD